MEKPVEDSENQEEASVNQEEASVNQEEASENQEEASVKEEEEAALSQEVALVKVEAEVISIGQSLETDPPEEEVVSRAMEVTEMKTTRGLKIEMPMLKEEVLLEEEVVSEAATLGTILKMNQEVPDTMMTTNQDATMMKEASDKPVEDSVILEVEEEEDSILKTDL
jgi:hypothetical protein